MGALADTRLFAGVQWMDWGPEVFQRARKEDKLVLLDSGATWCHWCHVMDRLTYEDEEVARVINDKFIAVRIDRDRLTEVDARFQREVPIIESEAGGWPLTVVLTPQGHALFKATFVPPRGQGPLGPIGMIELLKRLDEFWRGNRAQLEQAGRDLRKRISDLTEPAAPPKTQIDEKLLDTLFEGLAAQFDSQHGGFGEAPKFFAAPAVEFLLALAWTGQEQALDISCRTLEAIARGGVRDHLAGGFHRYSVDARWHVPHFEKMAYDNAALLALFANAFALTGRHDFADVARDTMRWINSTLLDGARRGFYSSQDADAAPDDDGDYFTWTVPEVRSALGEKADLAIYFYDLSDDGDMHDRHGRNVLHVPKTIQQAARLLGRPADELQRDLESARQTLLAERQKRPTPAVDRTIFADVNGMMIDAYLTAAERLGDAEARQIALEVLDNILADLRDQQGVFAHFQIAGAGQGIGLLADQAWMLRAMVHAFSASGNLKYLTAAQTLADYIQSHLTDADGSPLSSPQPASRGPADIQPSRGWEDTQGANAGAVACVAFLHLHRLLGQKEYAAWARKAMAAAGDYVQQDWAPMLGGVGLAADAMLHGPRFIVVSGSPGTHGADALLASARAAYIPAGMVVSADPSDPRQRELLEPLHVTQADQPCAYVCHGSACLAPAGSVQELRKRIQQLAAPE